MNHPPLLLSDLESDVTRFAANLSSLIFNERDLQVRLAAYLKYECDGRYDSVDMEYLIPISELGVTPNTPPDPTFPWHNNVYLDIVVSRGDEYAAIELKYATREITSQPTRFSTQLSSKAKIVKTQGAADIVMYNYCKDIRRIERLCQKYSKLKGGIALIITNNHHYWCQPGGEVIFASFSLHEGNDIGRGMMAWSSAAAPKIVDGHPNFIMAGQYRCHWADTKIAERTKPTTYSPDGNPFRFMLTTILPTPNSTNSN